MQNVGFLMTRVKLEILYCDFPCLQFHNGKSPSQYYFWCKFLNKKMWHFLQLLECKRMTRLYLNVDDLDQGDMQKGVFQRMVFIRRVVVGSSKI